MKIVAMIWLLVGCAGRFERGARYAATATVIGLIACDVGQTYKDSDGGRWDLMPAPGDVVLEGNPVLGPRPSPGLLAANLAVTTTVTTLVGVKAPRWLAWAYLGIVGAVETYIVTDPQHIKWSKGLCGV